MSTGGASRREVLLGAMALAAGAGRLASAATESTGTAARGGGPAQVRRRGGHCVLLHDPRVAAPMELVHSLEVAPTARLALDADPVRMWRGAHAALLGDRATHLAGATTWPQFLIVRGLAEESGRRVRTQRFDGDSGIVTWLMA